MKQELLEGNAQKALDLLFRRPYQEFTLSEVAKELKSSKTTTYRALLKLKGTGLITIVPIGRGGLWRIRANYENPEFRKHKIVKNLLTIYTSGVVEHLDKVFGHPKAIVLFGSFRKGEDITGSDIDIAIEIAEDKELEIHRLSELEEFEFSVERQLKLHVFNRKRIDLNLFNNIANGIVLSGFLEVNK